MPSVSGTLLGESMVNCFKKAFPRSPSPCSSRTFCRMKYLWSGFSMRETSAPVGLENKGHRFGSISLKKIASATGRSLPGAGYVLSGPSYASKQGSNSFLETSREEAYLSRAVPDWRSSWFDWRTNRRKDFELIVPANRSVDKTGVKSI